MTCATSRLGHVVISGNDILLFIWLFGTALNARPTLHRLARLSDRDPTQMCDGCRARRRSLLLDASGWEILGPNGAVGMVILEASTWWITPFVPAIRRMAGSEHQPRCVGRHCSAHARYQEVL